LGHGVKRRNLLVAGAAVGVGGGGVSDADAGAPAVLPRSVDAAYFGMHFHRLVRRPEERMPAAAWPALSFGTLRLWDSDTRWADVAPRAGEWSFERMDAYVNIAAANSASVLYTLGSPPRWASARPDEPGPYGPGSAAEPRNLAHWSEYLRRVLERYKGRIAAYELWNEPNFSDIDRDRGAAGFYTGDVATMVRMATLARQAINAIDPAAQLLTPGFVNGSDRLGLFLRSGGAALVDAVAYHFYARDSAHFQREVTEVRAVMRQHGVASLPLWNTECGVETDAPDAPLQAGKAARVTEESAAALLAQLLLLGAAFGLARFCYYAWDNGRSGMIDASGAQRPRQAALRCIEAWLIGARLTSAERLGRNGWLIRSEAGVQQHWFAWHGAPTPQAVSMPVGWRLVAIDTLASLPAQPQWIKPNASLALPASPEPIRLTLARS
jgi:hypothetical protein